MVKDPNKIGLSFRHKQIQCTPPGTMHVEDGGVNSAFFSSSYVENEARTTELWTAGVLLQMQKLQTEKTFLH